MEIIIGLGVLKGFGVALAPAAIRSTVGWAQKYAMDGVTKWEWRKLVATLLKVGLLTAAVYFSWDGFLGDADGFASGMSAVLIDMLWKKK